MGLFVTAPQTNTGVFAILQQPPSQIVAAGTDTAVVVGAFPWGPINQLTYPGGAPGGAYLATYAPNGSVRTSGGHMTVIRKAWPNLGIIRALPVTAAQATVNLTASGPTTLATLTAKYFGTTGNSIVVTTSAASDGVATHFNMLVTLSGASGFTTELYQNLNVSGTGANILPNLTNSTLLASFVFVASGTIQLQAYTMSGGTSPANTSTQYVGTQGGNDFGFALCEQDNTISHLYADDCSNALRVAVNGGLVTHVNFTSNKIGYLNGNSGQTAAAAQTDVANYRSLYACYVDPWANVFDDTTGAVQLAPGAAWGASIAANIPPSLDIGYRGPQQTQLFSGIASLEAQRGPSARSANSLAGISTLTGLQQGGFSFEGGFNTSATPGQTDLMLSRMDIYMAKSVATSWASYVNAPNIPFYQQDLINSLDQFLRQLVQNAKINPAFFPFIAAYRILAPSASNTAASIAAGQYTVAAQVQTGSAMRQIYFQLQAGAGVSVVSS